MRFDAICFACCHYCYYGWFLYFVFFFAVVLLLDFDAYSSSNSIVLATCSSVSYCQSICPPLLRCLFTLLYSDENKTKQNKIENDDDGEEEEEGRNVYHAKINNNMDIEFSCMCR